MSLQEEQVYDFVKKLREGRITRRQFLHAVSTVGGFTVASGVIPALLAACQPAGAPPAEQPAPAAQTQVQPTPAAPIQGGTLVAATIDKPVNMDPAFGELYSSIQVYDNVFAKLLYLTRDYEIIPGLAKAWRQIDDTTWEFDLVDNAWFHNDEQFTAQDVKYTFERIFSPDLGASMTVFFAPFEGVEIVDDFKVRIITRANWGGLPLALAAFSEIVNQKGVEANDPKLMPIGCGPFKFVEWVKDDHITLERWEKYHVPGRPYLDRVVFRAIADDEVRLTGLLTGELNWIEQVPLQRVEELRQNPEIKANPNGAFFPDMFLLNTSKPPFDKVEVRQALQWAFDRTAIARLVWFGQAFESAEAVAPENPWYSGVNMYEGAPNLDKAKELLAKAGYPNGFRTKFAAQPQVPTQPQVGQLLQQQLKPLGIDVEVQSFESARWFEELATQRYEITSTYWSATVDPGDHCYYPLTHSTSPWNFAFFKGPAEMDAALDTFRFTLDPEERKQAYTEVVRLHQEQSPEVFQVNFLRTYWTQPNVHGAATLPTLELRMEDVWIG
jgi:peptide/nickel transport system substrate-binding protein